MFPPRMRIAKRTDDRVSIMNELIQGIQVIKMYAWEMPFRNVVKDTRKKEVDQIEKAQYIRGVYMSTMVFTERSTLFLAILVCIMQGQAITADLVFPMATFFNVLQLTAAIFYPLAVSLGAEALVNIFYSLPSAMFNFLYYISFIYEIIFHFTEKKTYEGATYTEM